MPDHVESFSAPGVETGRVALRAERVLTSVPFGKTASPAELVPQPADSLRPVALCPFRGGAEVVATVPTPSFAAEVRVQR